MLLKTYTLGCKVNQYETEYLRGGFGLLGYRDATEEQTADLILVNTCTVTAQSDFKSRKLIRKLAKENPGAKIIVLGCYAARCPEELRREPGVVEVVTDKRTLPDLLIRYGLPDPPKVISQFGERHRAYIKVQDGCIVGCSYCIIPKVRPYLLSRNAQDITEEVRTLARNGFSELVLTGIHLGHYGLDLDSRPRLAELTASLLELIRRESLPLRLRLSSLEAVEVSEELIALFSHNSRELCPHLHLSMQSGSEEVLRNMKRRLSSAAFLEKCERIKAAVPHISLSTDVIVGFPGESESQFEETCESVRRVGFSKVHVFRFSPREGTEAATMSGQISPIVKKERAARLQRLADELRRDFARSLCGRTIRVLSETRCEDGSLLGTCERYMNVRLTPSSNQPGQLLDAEVLAVEGETLLAETAVKSA